MIEYQVYIDAECLNIDRRIVAMFSKRKTFVDTKWKTFEIIEQDFEHVIERSKRG